jgi:hypothetical protein
MIYIKIHPLSDKKEEMKSYVFNVDQGLFEKITPSKIKNIEERKFFTPNGKGGYKAARRKNDYKSTILEEWGRDYRTLRRSHNHQVENFAEDTVLVLSQPHKYVYKRNKTARNKYVYDPLNYTFFVISNDDYKSIGLSKPQRGALVILQNGKWIRLGGRKATYHKSLNEVDAQKVSDDVAENLMIWKAKNKYERHCETCINDCKQTALIKLPWCKNYKTPKGINKRRFTLNDQ